MNQLTLRLGQKIKKVTVTKTNSAADISKMIESVFRLRERLIGVTDEYGKFYDLQFVSDNLRILSSHTLNLVLARDANEEILSFGTPLLIFSLLKHGNTPQKIRTNSRKYIVPAPHREGLSRIYR